MEATIIDVMETWPLQLRLMTPTGKLKVRLAENVHVKRGGVLVGPGELSPDQRVRVLNQETNGAVSELEIVDSNKKGLFINKHNESKSGFKDLFE